MYGIGEEESRQGKKKDIETAAVSLVDALQWKVLEYILVNKSD